MRIAILDSNPIILEEVQGAASGSFECSEIRVFENAKDLLEAVKTTYFDVVIMEHKYFDLNMPTEIVLLWLRQYGFNTYGKHSYVIVVSNEFASLKNEINFLTLGADDYFEKPVNIPKLLLKLKNHLNVHKQSQAIKNEYKSFFTPKTNIKTEQVSANNSIQKDLYGTSVKEIKLVESQMVMGYYFDFKNKRVTLPSGEAVHLSNVLFRIALLFLMNVGVPLSKENILTYSKISDLNCKNLAVYISMFKKALKLNKDSNLYLHSIYGYGYKLNIQKEKVESW